MTRLPGANQLSDIAAPRLNPVDGAAPLDPEYYKLPETVKVWVHWSHRKATNGRNMRVFGTQEFAGSLPLACEVLGMFSGAKSLNKTFRVDLITLQYPIPKITKTQATELCEVIKARLAHQIEYKVTRFTIDRLDH